MDKVRYVPGSNKSQDLVDKVRYVPGSTSLGIWWTKYLLQGTKVQGPRGKAVDGNRQPGLTWNVFRKCNLVRFERK